MKRLCIFFFFFKASFPWSHCLSWEKPRKASIIINLAENGHYYHHHHHNHPHLHYCHHHLLLWLCPVVFFKHHTNPCHQHFSLDRYQPACLLWQKFRPHQEEQVSSNSHWIITMYCIIIIIIHIITLIKVMLFPFLPHI